MLDQGIHGLIEKDGVSVGPGGYSALLDGKIGIGNNQFRVEADLHSQPAANFTRAERIIE